MPVCPAGHRSGTADWCDVCGRPVDTGPAPCPGCDTPLAGRFCDECGADTAVPAPTVRIAPDPDWFAHVRRRSGARVRDLVPPSSPPYRVRLDHRRVVLGRRRPGSAPDVDLRGDAGVSARHALLVAGDDGTWGVVDLGSRNGTAVGSCDPVTPFRAVPVPPGVPVRLGLWTSVLIEP